MRLLVHPHTSADLQAKISATVRNRSFSAKQRAEEIPLHDPWWRTVERVRGYPANDQLRERVARNRYVLDWYWEDNSPSVGALNAFDDAEDALIEETETSKENKKMERAALTERRRVAQRSRAEERSKKAESKRERAERQAIAGNLIYRFAELQERDLCLAAREWLPHYADVAREFSREEVGHLVDRAAHARRLVTTYQEIGLPVRKLHTTLQRIAAAEASSVPKRLRASVRAALPLIQAIAQEPGSDHALRAYDAAIGRFTRLRYEAKFTLAVDDGDQVLLVEYTNQSGYLRMLDLAATVVAAKYSWSHEGALIFLTCGETATFKVARIDYDVRTTHPRCLSRVHLTVDPTLSADEVMALYAHAKRRILPYHRELSPLQLALANHVYSQTNYDTSSDDSDNWEELMDSWNRWVPHLRIKSQRGGRTTYSRVSTFREDAKAARELLLNPQVESPLSPLEYPPRRVFLRKRQVKPKLNKHTGPKHKRDINGT
jgi:hypothetical protein